TAAGGPLRSVRGALSALRAPGARPRGPFGPARRPIGAGDELFDLGILVLRQHARHRTTGDTMKRRSTSRSTAASGHSWAAPVSALATAVAAAVMAAGPVDVTVTLGSAPDTAVVGQADVPNPVCPVTPR
ncbi:hypothetical protein ACFWOB_38475, partial [Streptomyces sp. NPDC058420]|uniref:hypothetical protein n=1 Tax=Streptomyces sp. NPDC058420 TaxID=3346489 RepID=UPI0036463E23